MRKITGAQVKELRRWWQRKGSLKLAALKAGLDRKTARKYREGAMASERRQKHRWRTRTDPLAGVWGELAAELERAPALQGGTLLTLLQQRHPGQFPDTLLRTVQRRVRRWRALYGPAKEVFFAQVHEAGRLGASDFTHLSDMGVTICGQPFAHLLYHFVLTHSNWEHVTVCVSECFTSLSVGLQNALWALGGRAGAASDGSDDVGGASGRQRRGVHGELSGVARALRRVCGGDQPVLGQLFV